MNHEDAFVHVLDSFAECGDLIGLNESRTPFELLDRDSPATPYRLLSDRGPQLPDSYPGNLDCDPGFVAAAPALRMKRFHGQMEVVGNTLVESLVPIFGQVLAQHRWIALYTTAMAVRKLRRAFTFLTEEQLAVCEAIELIMRRKKNLQLCEKGAGVDEISAEIRGRSTHIDLEFELRTLLSRSVLRLEMADREYYSIT